MSLHPSPALRADFPLLTCTPRLQLLQLAREVQTEFSDSTAQECQVLLRRCVRLERWLAASDDHTHNPCGLLWIDEVYSSLGVALDAGRRLRERAEGEQEPPPSCMRSLFGRLCGRRKRSPNEREFETIRTSAHVVHEWLSAYAALHRESGPTRDADPSVISLGDPAPHLSEQFVPVHRETHASVKAALIDAQRSATTTAKPATVFMRGPRGVGKSVLAATLVRDPYVTQLFSGGPSWLQLGHDYTEEDVCDAIVSMVDALVGGAFDAAVRHEVTLAGIVAQARCRLDDT
eukprot:IDg12884t1